MTSRYHALTPNGYEGTLAYKMENLAGNEIQNRIYPYSTAFVNPL